jgi:hypothetical protein
MATVSVAIDPQELEIRWVPFDPPLRTETVDFGGKRYIDVRVGTVMATWQSPIGRVTFGGQSEHSEPHPDDIEGFYRSEWARKITDWWYSQPDVATVYGAASTPSSAASARGH